MLNVFPFTRKEMVKEVELLDDEMQSRYDKIHGEVGLFYTLVETSNATAKLRLEAEYNDHQEEMRERRRSYWVEKFGFWT